MPPSKILVLGPHRSGTTFVARCIAHDLDYEFIPEECIFGSNRSRLNAYLNSAKNLVIQCPWMAPIIHQFAGPNIKAVWVIRDPQEIYRSRANLRNSRGEPLPWMQNEAMLRARYNAPAGGDLLTIQYRNWQQQRERFEHWEEVHYNDYKTHPLYIEDRKGYHLRQIDPVSRVDRKPWKGDPILCF